MINHLIIFNYLILSGADLCLGSGTFGNCIHLICYTFNDGLLQSVIDQKNPLPNLNQQDSSGNTPLHVVMKVQIIKIFKITCINSMDISNINRTILFSFNLDF